MRLCGIAIAIAAFCGPAPCLAATVSTDNDTMRISGTIISGDAARVAAAMTPAVTQIVLTSTGGDTEEGIAIGEFLRGRNVETIVDGYCMSSCANYIFPAGTRRVVRRNSVVCFHGGTPRTRDELHNYITHVIEDSNRYPAISPQEIDLIVDSEWDRFGKNARDEISLMKSLGIDDRILVDSRVRMVSRHLIARSRFTERRFMEDEKIAWCPSPDLLRKYGIATEHMWYPRSGQELYDTGQRISRDFVLVRHSAADLPPAEADRYVPTQDYEGGLKISPDLADLYNNLGVIDENNGLSGKALAAYEVSIRLKPEAPWPYINRGVAYAKDGHYAEALADYDTAIRIKPDYAPVRRNLASAYVALGRYDDAIKEFDATLKLAPGDGGTLTDRGRANFDAGRFAAAANDLAGSIRRDPAQPYAVLWLHLARQRSGEDDSGELAANASKLDLGAWPGPLVAFYRGQSSEAQAMRRAVAPDPKISADQRCEASFYVGEDALAHRNRQQAEKLLLSARESCPPDFVEHDGAMAELARLGS